MGVAVRNPTGLDLLGLLQPIRVITYYLLGLLHLLGLLGLLGLLPIRVITY